MKYKNFDILQEEIKANKGKVIDDPFTRRSTRPKMFSKQDVEEEVPAPTVAVIETIQKPVVKEKEVVPEVKKKQNTDLFNAHNFDITIDLEVPSSSKILRNNYLLKVRLFL